MATAPSRGPSFMKNAISTQIRAIDPKKHDLNVTKALHYTLLRVKSGEEGCGVRSDEFIYCDLHIQSASKEVSELKFRVKVSWTGFEVKMEIHRLYEIPTNYQVLIVNRLVISDQETLENCHFQQENQIIYIILTKNRIRYRNSAIRLCDFLPKRDIDSTMEEDNHQPLMTPQSSEENGLLTRQPMEDTGDLLPKSRQSANKSELLRPHPLSITSQRRDENELSTRDLMLTSSPPSDHSALLRNKPPSMLSKSEDAEGLLRHGNETTHQDEMELEGQTFKNDLKSGCPGDNCAASASGTAQTKSSSKRGRRNKKKRNKRR